MNADDLLVWVVFIALGLCVAFALFFDRWLRDKEQLALDRANRSPNDILLVVDPEKLGSRDEQGRFKKIPKLTEVLAASSIVPNDGPLLAPKRMSIEEYTQRNLEKE